MNEEETGLNERRSEAFRTVVGEFSLTKMTHGGALLMTIFKSKSLKILETRLETVIIFDWHSFEVHVLRIFL